MQDLLLLALTECFDGRGSYLQGLLPCASQTVIFYPISVTRMTTAYLPSMPFYLLHTEVGCF